MAPGPQGRSPDEVGLGLVDGRRAFLESLTPQELAEHLIGGLATDHPSGKYRSGHLVLAHCSADARE